MTLTVPSQQPSKIPCKIAFVAEAPSDEELITKVPLTGPAGRVFNAMLRSAELERAECFVGNVFNEKAEDNDCTEWMKDDVRCQENFTRLSDELSSIKPNVIVPLGGTALWAFTGQKGITPFRGSVTTATRIVSGAKLLPTFHPSAVQRDWRLLSIVVGDFIKAAKEAALGPKIIYPKLQLLIEPTLQDIQEFAVECLSAPKLSVDIETGWGQITAIAFAPSTSRALSIPFVDLRRASRSYWNTGEAEMAVWRLVQQICEAPNPKVGQNFLYDIAWLHEKHGISLRNYRFDTRLRHKVLYPELPADLASMGGSYTNLGAWKNWGGKYQRDKKDG